ncbi:MAG: CHAT domain-containing protein [bacterium]|nr:CHAT domain-containing protein [bacterium]
MVNEYPGESVRRILFLSAGPKNSNRLETSKEIKKIREKLQLSKERDRFEIHTRTAVGPEDFTQALLDIKPAILHFAGHGSKDGAIFLEDGIGFAHPVKPETMARLLKLLSQYVECVILSACHSHKQVDAISEHISYAIGMRREISDSTAIAFSVGFYQALGAGEPFDKAYEFGITQIEFKNLPGSLIPVLKEKALPAPITMNDRIDRGAKDNPESSNQSHALNNPPQEMVKTDFYGRGSELAALHGHISRKENLLLIAEPRMGKTCLLERLVLKQELPVVPVYVDLLHFNRQTGELPRGILGHIKNALREHGLISFHRWQNFSLTDGACFIEKLGAMIAEAKEKHKAVKLLLLLDGAEKVFEEGDSVWEVLRSLLQCELAVVTVIAGSNRLLKGNGNLEETNPFNSFVILRLPPLSKEETAGFLKDRFSRAALDYEPGLLEVIYDLSGGMPYYTDRIAGELIEYSQCKSIDTVTEKDMKEIFAHLLRKMSQDFEEDYQRLEKQEKAILEATAKKHALDKFAKRDIRDLEKKQLLVKENGMYRFVVRLFEEWFKRDAG